MKSGDFYLRGYFSNKFSTDQINPLKIYSSTHTHAKPSEGTKTNASPCWSSDEAPEHFLRENHKKWVSNTEGMCQQTPTNNWRRATGKWADSSSYIISKTTHWKQIIMTEKTCIYEQLYIYFFLNQYSFQLETKHSWLLTLHSCRTPARSALLWSLTWILTSAWRSSQLWKRKPWGDFLFEPLDGAIN